MIQRSLTQSSELIGPRLCMSPLPHPVSLWSTFEVQSHLAFCLPLCVVGTGTVSPYLPLLAHCLAQGLNSESERFPGGCTFLCQRRWAAIHGRNWASERRWEIRRSHLPVPRIREELEIFLKYQESAFRLSPQGGMVPPAVTTWVYAHHSLPQSYNLNNIFYWSMQIYREFQTVPLLGAGLPAHCTPGSLQLLGLPDKGQERHQLTQGRNETGESLQHRIYFWRQKGFRHHFATQYFCCNYLQDKSRPALMFS